MLKISAAQVRQVDATHVGRFDQEMQAHLARFAPLVHAHVGDAGIAAVVRHGVQAAERLGLTRRGPVRLYLEMMTMFGSGFVKDPQYGALAEILYLDIPDMQRADLLAAAVETYAAVVTGPDNANLWAACLRLQQFHDLPDPDAYPTEFDAMAAVFGDIFPQKLVHMGRRAFGRLTHRARGASLRLRTADRRSEWTLLGLMLFFGHGCFDDPQYPWIGAALRNRSPVDPDASVTHLERKARIWLDAALVRQARGATA